MTAVSQDVVLVASAAQLEAAAAAWRNCPVLALDTEFMRERTYRAELCLVQIGWTGGAICVDPIALDSVAALRSRGFRNLSA